VGKFAASDIIQRNIDWHCEKTHSENCIRYDTVVPQYHFFGTTYQDGKYGSPEKCAAQQSQRNPDGLHGEEGRHIRRPGGLQPARDPARGRWNA
jgi:hypothetical protein